MTDKKCAIFVEDLATQNIPVEALVQGIRLLAAQELRLIKLATVIEAARKFVQHEISAACDRCYDGIVLMRDEKRYQFSLGCPCARGQQRAQSLKISTWNGKQTQISRGRLLTLDMRI